jgi:hypothetical protein
MSKEEQHPMIAMKSISPSKPLAWSVFFFSLAAYLSTGSYSLATQQRFKPHLPQTPHSRHNCAFALNPFKTLSEQHQNNVHAGTQSNVPGAEAPTETFQQPPNSANRRNV